MTYGREWDLICTPILIPSRVRSLPSYPSSADDGTESLAPKAIHTSGISQCRWNLGAEIRITGLQLTALKRALSNSRGCDMYARFRPDNSAPRGVLMDGLSFLALGLFILTGS